MAVAHKGAISFGLVNIPVVLYTATQDISISFNQLHKTAKQRIKYKKLVLLAILMK
jgi:DNA end-binding protein Ku